MSGVILVLLGAVLVLVIVSLLMQQKQQKPSDQELQAQNLAQAAYLQQHLQPVLDAQARLVQNDVVQLKGGVDALRQTNATQMAQLQQTTDSRLDAVTKQLMDLLQANAQNQANMQKSLSDEMEKLRSDNRASMTQIREDTAKSLEQIRGTVDEKLQDTLEKRIGESFERVSKRLEEVQKGLGEMHSLAGDVGSLKRVLSNVKNRGIVGETFLKSQISDILTPSQYQENSQIDPESRARVEFAIKLPGKTEDKNVLLPIDSKFPQEPYEQLLNAQDAGDITAIENAQKELKKTVQTQAKEINKYIVPPYSTDFAIMYLPTEGLFAEVIRIPGLVAEIQEKDKVVVAGPTTLAVMLNALQIGFKTLAIEKRSVEVWGVLAQVKKDFSSYIDTWEKLDRQLQTAQRTVNEVGSRGRTVNRRLDSLATLEEIEAASPEVDA